MKQLIEDLISAIEYHVEQTRPIHSTTIALQAARDALKSLPPQRTWVGLTLDDIPDDDTNNLDFYQGGRWAERVLKEKNNG